MGVQSFLKKAFAASLTTMDAEDVTFGAQTVKAVIDESEAGRGVNLGSDDLKRTITVKIPADVLTSIPKSGQKFTARGQEWQIPSEPTSIKAGQVAVEIVGEEPERRR